MNRLVCIGEGKGERLALPQLCNSIRHFLGVPISDWSVDPELVRIPRAEFVAPRLTKQKPSVCNERGIRRAIELSLTRPKPANAVLVLCDVDDDCVRQWVESFKSLVDSRLRVVPIMASREFESWLLWNHAPADLERVGVPDPETKRDAKGALAKLVPGYQPTTHQLEQTKRIDVRVVRERSRSFDKLVRELARLFGAEGGGGRPLVARPGG